MLTIVLSRGIEVPRDSIPPSLDEQLRERFTHSNPKRILLEKLGKWAEGEPRFIEHFEATEDRLILPRGGTTAVAELLDRSGIPWEVSDQRVSFPPIDFALGERSKDINLRGYQYTAIDAAIRGENCLIRSATGSGKTEIALELIRNLKQPTLVIVWTASLASQWIDRIVDRWGWDPTEIGLVGAGKKRPGKKITIALQQSLARDMYGLDRSIGALIVDEVQRASARTFREVVDAFPAKYRIGFSADERRKDGMEFLTRESFGSITAEISKDTLVDAGHLCEVEIVLVPTESTHPAVEAVDADDRRTVVREMYTEILRTIETDDRRNDLIRSLAAGTVKDGRSTLIFCNRIPQARELARKLVVLEGVQTGLMLGGAENRDEFEHTKTRMKTGELLCAVGSSATYQGEDIPRLSVGILVTPLASNRPLFEQVVGRLRRKYPGKVRGRLYVIWDEKLFPHHADNLRKWYGARLVKRIEDLR